MQHISILYCLLLIYIELTMDRKIYYIKDVEQLIGKSRITLRRWWEKNKFPKPTLINSRVAWSVDSINEWIKQNMTPKQCFESLPKETQDHLLHLKSIPGALERFFQIAKDINSGKLRREDIIDPETNEIIGGVLIEN